MCLSPFEILKCICFKLLNVFVPICACICQKVCQGNGAEPSPKTLLVSPPIQCNEKEIFGFHICAFNLSYLIRFCFIPRLLLPSPQFNELHCDAENKDLIYLEYQYGKVVKGIWKFKILRKSKSFSVQGEPFSHGQSTKTKEKSKRQRQRQKQRQRQRKMQRQGKRQNIQRAFPFQENPSHMVEPIRWTELVEGSQKTGLLHVVS